MRPAREEWIAHIGRSIGVEGTVGAAMSEVMGLCRESRLPQHLRSVGLKRGTCVETGRCHIAVQWLVVFELNPQRNVWSLR